MPPKGARRTTNVGASRERSRTKPKGVLIPPLTPRWPHLPKGKQVREPLEPQPGYGCLSLSIPTLASHTAERGWELLSSRACFFSPQKAADEAAQLVKRDKEAVERQQEIERELARQKEQRKVLAGRRVAFLSLKLSGSALEESQLPFAQFWRTNRVVKAVLDFEQDTQTEDIKPSDPCTTSTPPTSLPSCLHSNELGNEPQGLIPETGAASAVVKVNLGLANPLTPEAPEFSPITPTYPVSDYAPLILSASDLTDVREGFCHSDLEYPYPNNPYDMAGDSSVNTGGVDESIKDVIQNLFVIQQHVASFRPEHQDGLNKRVEDLAGSLTRLDSLVTNPSNPIHDIKIAPDIIDYVDDGRNPDIYTRDFVELVQRGNAVLNGKQKAFRNFSKIFAQSLKENFDGMDEEVDMIMENAGIVEEDGKYVEKQQNGSTSRV